MTATLLAFLLMLASPAVFAQDRFINRSLCVYSPVGKSGPVTNTINKYKVAALRWDVRFNVELYSDEIIALEDFQSGRCDAVLLSDVRTRELVRFGGGISQVGAIPTFKHLRRVIDVLSRPEASDLMQNERYEVAGFFPVGRVYLFLGPGVMNTTGPTLEMSDLAGKRFAVLGYDAQSRAAAKRLGTSVVKSDITSIFGKFNNRSVDMVASTASAYKPMELYKGLGENGRIVREPSLAMMSFQITLHRDRFPDKFGLKSRRHALSMFDFTRRMALSYRSKVPDEYWLDPPKSIKNQTRSLLADLRRDLTQKGVYDPRMTALFRRIRCNISPGRAECA